MTKVYFSEQPEAIRYKPMTNGFVDIWLRTNIEEIIQEDPDGSEVISWQANENYFRAKSKVFTREYVEQNFDSLLSFTGETPVEASIEDRLADIEATLAAIIGGMFG